MIHAALWCWDLGEVVKLAEDLGHIFSYSFNFGHGHEQSLSMSVGLLIPIP